MSTKGRSFQFGIANFGPGLPTNQTLGQLVDEGNTDRADDLQFEGIDRMGRTLYVQCDPVSVNGNAPGSAVDDGAGNLLYPVVELTFAGHDLALKQIVDVGGGALVRIPIAGNFTRATGRLLKAPTTGLSNLAWSNFNNPGKNLEAAPGAGQTFSMRAFLAERSVGGRPMSVNRYFQGTKAIGASIAIPLAAGVEYVRLLCDPSVIANYTLNQASTTAGLTIYGPFLPNDDPIEVPSGCTFLVIPATAGTTPFTVVNILGMG